MEKVRAEFQKEIGTPLENQESQLNWAFGGSQRWNHKPRYIQADIQLGFIWMPQQLEFWPFLTMLSVCAIISPNWLVWHQWERRCLALQRHDVSWWVYVSCPPSLRGEGEEEIERWLMCVCVGGGARSRGSCWDVQWIKKIKQKEKRFTRQR